MSTPPEPGAAPPVRERLTPAGARRSWATVGLITVVLVLTTLVLGRFGLEDFSTALTFPGRITGAVLILVAVTTLLGVAAVLDHWFRNSFPYSGIVALISAVAASLANALLLAKTMADGDSVPYQVVSGVLMGGSLFAVYALWRTSVVIPAPKRVAAALVVSSVLAVANFGYQNLYQPSQQGTKPLIRLTMGDPVLSKDHRAFSVPVEIQLENHSNVGFYVLGTEFHAMGDRVPLSPKDRLRDKWRADAAQWTKFQEKNPLSRREVHQPGELVTAQPWMPYGNWVEAHDEFTARTIVQLPIDTPYDQVAFYAKASLARKDRLSMEGIEFTGFSWNGGKVPRWVNVVNGRNVYDSLVYRARVHENNAIDERTMDPRYVTVYWKFGTNGADIATAITRKGEEGRVQSQAESSKLVSRYGLIEAVTGPIERTLWDIKSQR